MVPSLATISYPNILPVNREKATLAAKPNQKSYTYIIDIYIFYLLYPFYAYYL